MSNLHQQRKVNVIRAGKPVGAKVEEQVTEMDWEDSFVDSFSVNSSNVFPSSSSLSIKRKPGQEDQEDESEPSEKKVRIKEDRHKFRIPVTLSWSNRDGILCTKELNVLVDTGFEITCKWGSGLLKSRLCFLTSKKHKQDYKQRGTTTWGEAQ